MQVQTQYLMSNNLKSLTIVVRDFYEVCFMTSLDNIGEYPAAVIITSPVYYD